MTSFLPSRKKGRGQLEMDYASPTLTWSWELGWALSWSLNAGRISSPDTTFPGSGTCAEGSDKNGLSWHFSTTSRSAASIRHNCLRPCKQAARALVLDLHQTWNTLNEKFWPLNSCGNLPASRTRDTTNYTLWSTSVCCTGWCRSLTLYYQQSICITVNFSSGRSCAWNIEIVLILMTKEELITSEHIVNRQREMSV